MGGVKKRAGLEPPPPRMQSTCGIWGGGFIEMGGGNKVGGHRAHIGGYGTKWGGGTDPEVGAQSPN